VTPVKLVPVIVTTVTPPQPLVGVKELIVGAVGGLQVKVSPLTGLTVELMVQEEVVPVVARVVAAQLLVVVRPCSSVVAFPVKPTYTVFAFVPGAGPYIN
jgi:hypothetical protein